MKNGAQKKGGLAHTGSLGHAYVIAEMACSHEGKFELAEYLIDAAAEAKADAVQFQIFCPDEYVHPDDQDYELARRLAFSAGQWKKLFLRARKNRLEVVAAAGDRASIDLAMSQDVDGFKVHSADLNNPYILDYMAPLGKPMTLGVGGSYWSEIKKGVDRIKKLGNKNIILMYGMQNFPTSFELLNLLALSELKRAMKLPVGYQDHTEGGSVWGLWIPVMSLGLGASVLEKHITHDRSKKGIDHQSALDPGEFREFVALVRKAETILGKRDLSIFNSLTEDAKKYRAYAKMRNVVTSRRIRRGDVLKEEDLMVMRYRKGTITAGELGSVVGKKAMTDMPRLHPVSKDDIKACAS